MHRKRFTEEQIIGILKEAEAGAKSVEFCRRHAISEQMFYWSMGIPSWSNFMLGTRRVSASPGPDTLSAEP
jgi:putative transposase